MLSSQGSPEAAEEEAAQGRAARSGKRAAPAGELQPAKLSRAELYRPPTSEELSQLKETEDLFHSSLLRLQVSREGRGAGRGWGRPGSGGVPGTELPGGACGT